MFVSAAVPEDMTLPDAHELASRLEDDIRAEQPHMQDVVVHTEPYAAATCVDVEPYPRYGLL